VSSSFEVRLELEQTKNRPKLAPRRTHFVDPTMSKRSMNKVVFEAHVKSTKIDTVFMQVIFMY